MSGHLCLKWNNHSSAFLKSLCNIQIKERYCDATIACQGKYFPVHRIILSTCSDYFEEMFERMQCQHPYIVFKDIEPKEMELLLDYMYQGEVNVVQEMLPTLIKAAEALRVKGLAVPDEMPSGKDYSTGRKRSNSSNDSPQAKRKSEEVKKGTQGLSDPIRTEETEGAVSSNVEESNSGNDPTSFSLYETNAEANAVMKQEPEDPLDYSHDSLPVLSAMPTASESQFRAKIEAIYNSSDTYVKPEDNVPENESSAEPQVPSPWTIFSAMSSAVNHDSSNPDNMLGVNTGLEALSTRRKELCPRRPPDRAEYNAQSGQKRPEFVAREEESDGYCVQGAKPFEYSSHGPDSSLRKCQHCAYETDDKYRLERHILFKHQGLRPFPCPICPLRCALRTDLERHMLIHTGEKPFQCPHCKFKFRRKAHLNVHMARQNCGAKK